MYDDAFNVTSNVACSEHKQSIDHDWSSDSVEVAHHSDCTDDSGCFDHLWGRLWMGVLQDT